VTANAASRPGPNCGAFDEKVDLSFQAIDDTTPHRRAARAAV